MVDPIGIKAGTVTDRRLAPVAPAEPVAATRNISNREGEAAEAPAVKLLAREMGREAPVDSERVAEIRRAVQNGTFPLVPSTIADRMLALKMDWNPNEPS
jgi:negative regulator of flagellin synthesis FlgM